MRVKIFLSVFLVLLLSACGPIIGSMMVASNGVKDFKVVSGQLSDLKAGSKVLVLGPFAKSARGFYICRGEDASVFTSSFNQTGLFAADFHMEDRFADNSGLIAELQSASPAEIKAKLKLKDAPQLLMTGTILYRETVAAPKQGVIMKVTYQLEFKDLENGRKTVVKVEVHELFQDAIPAAVKELARQITG